jgi:hypothetical protein
MDEEDRHRIGGNLGPPMTLEDEIRAALGPLEAEADKRVAEAGRAVIDSQEAAERVAALGGILADINARAEAQRKILKDPVLKAGKQIDAAFTVFANPVSVAMQELRLKINTWRKEQEKIAEAERARQREIAAEAERKAKEAEEANRPATAARHAAEAEAAQQQAAKPVAAAAPIRSAFGPTASARLVWKSEILNFAELPKEIRNHAKVKDTIRDIVQAMVRGGARAIPGVKIWSENDTTFRR